MADIRKFMDRGGVSTLWTKVAEKVKAEETRAKLAEQAALEAAQAAQKDVDDLEQLVGVLPEGTSAKDVVDYVNIKTTGIATDAALEELQNQLNGAEKAIDAIEADYLKAADKTELQGNIDALADTVEILSEGIDAEKVDGVKDLIKYVEEHGTEVTGMKEDISENAAAIKTIQEESLVGLDGRLDVLEAKFGGAEGSVEDQIADAKQAAIDAAAADATSKANAAEANAKSHAETKATEAKEAAILFPIWPDFPMPVIIILPVAFCIKSSAKVKFSKATESFKLFIASISALIVLNADCLSSCDLFSNIAVIQYSLVTSLLYYKGRDFQRKSRPFIYVFLIFYIFSQTFTSIWMS